MGYRKTATREFRWGPRRGLEGPFYYPNGRVAYYDPQAGQYWDPTTDFYIPAAEINDLKNSVFDQLRG
jgi:hypothetical protein